MNNKGLNTITDFNNHLCFNPDIWHNVGTSIYPCFLIEAVNVSKSNIALLMEY
jgi:hypothetical protein